MQVRLRFLREETPVEPYQKDLAALAVRYTTLLARARFGSSFEIRVTLANDPNVPTPEGPA